jgi:small subunit ribosomal protein S1
MKKQKNHFQEYKDFLKPPKEGDIVKGIVIEKEKEGVFLDLVNYKTGLVKKDDLRFGGKNISKIKKGEELSVKIIGQENEQGLIPVSLKEATEDIVWQDLQKNQEENKILNLKVVSANKGGLMFNVFGISGFMPVSQLSKKNYPKLENPTPDRIFQELKKFVGKEMKVRVITVDKFKKKLILKEA